MKMLRVVSYLILLIVLMATFCLPGIALAQDEEQPVSDNVTLVQEEEEPVPEPILAPQQEEPEERKIQEKIILRPDFPTVEAIAGSDFEFQIELIYIGEDAKVFDLRTTAPTGWEVYMTPRYEKERKITSINLKPAITTGETIRLVAEAPFWPLPEPGEYNINFEAVSDTIQSSTKLTAKVTAKYVLTTVSANERYDTTAKAGEDNVFSIKVRNLGTDAIDNVQFSPNNPQGWSVTFKPDKIDVLEAIDEQAVEVNIKPPPKTVAGDYMISLRASGKQATADEMSIRVTVETPTIWGWVGVAIILVVVIGLIVIFMRFSRR
jgi:uncharacterized membrane protein